MLQIGQQALDDVFDRDGLIVGERLERRELEEVAVLDLRDAAAEQPFGTQRLEDSPERFAVDGAVVVSRIAESVVAVQDAVLTVTVKPADQMRFEVEADRLVEALADDDADRMEAFVFLRAGEVLPHLGCRIHRLTDVQLIGFARSCRART